MNYSKLTCDAARSSSVSMVDARGNGFRSTVVSIAPPRSGGHTRKKGRARTALSASGPHTRESTDCDAQSPSTKIEPRGMTFVLAISSRVLPSGRANVERCLRESAVSAARWAAAPSGRATLRSSARASSGVIFSSSTSVCTRPATSACSALSAAAARR